MIVSALTFPQASMLNILFSEKKHSNTGLKLTFGRAGGVTWLLKVAWSVGYKRYTVSLEWNSAVWDSECLTTAPSPLMIHPVTVLNLSRNLAFKLQRNKNPPATILRSKYFQEAGEQHFAK